jgi:hypothetical protein
LTFPDRWVTFSPPLIKQHGGKIVYRLIIAGIAAAALVIFAMGCGGGGSDQTTAQVSEAQFMKQARAICAKTQKDLEVTFRNATNTEKLSQQGAAMLKQEVEALEAIDGTQEVEAKVAPLISGISEASEILAKEGAKALSNPRTVAYKREAANLNLSLC